MSPDASYCSPKRRSGDMYRNDPTDVLDIALELSNDRDIPKSESLTSPLEFYLIQKNNKFYNNIRWWLRIKNHYYNIFMKFFIN